MANCFGSSLFVFRVLRFINWIVYSLKIILFLIDPLLDFMVLGLENPHLDILFC